MSEPLTLQRIVDGEYHPEELRSWVQRAESSPKLWRELALAFLEDQAWSAAFRSDTEKNTGEPAADAPSPVVADADLQPTGASSAQRASSRRSRWRLSGAWSTLAAVAALVVVLAVVNAWPRGGGEPFQPDSDTRNPVVADRAPSLANELGDRLHDDSTPKTDGTTLISYRPDYRMKLLNDQGKPAGSDIPLFTAESARRMGYSLEPSPIDQDVLQQWAQSGYFVTQDVDYLTGKLDDSRQCVIPIRRLKVHVGQ